jgi:hypothetical protein
LALLEVKVVLAPPFIWMQIKVNKVILAHLAQLDYKA